MKWKMDAQATASITVEADSREQALEEGLLNVSSDSLKLEWKNFKILPKTLEVVNENN